MYFSSFGFSKEQQATHPLVDIRADCVQAFVPQQRVTVSTALAYSVQLALPYAATDIAILLQGEKLPVGKAEGKAKEFVEDFVEAGVTGQALLLADLLDKAESGKLDTSPSRPGELPAGRELLSAIFTPLTTDAEALIDTPASGLGLVQSALSFRVPGMLEPVPLLFPRVQCGDFVGSSGTVSPMID